MLKLWLADHCGYVRNQTLDRATGEHLSLPGHSLSDLLITGIEQSKRHNTLYRKLRGKYHINLFNTFYKDLNKKNKQWWVGCLYLPLIVNKFLLLRKFLDALASLDLRIAH